MFFFLVLQSSQLTNNCAHNPLSKFILNLTNPRIKHLSLNCGPKANYSSLSDQTNTKMWILHKIPSTLPIVTSTKAITHFRTSTKPTNTSLTYSTSRLHTAQVNSQQCHPNSVKTLCKCNNRMSER